MLLRVSGERDDTDYDLGAVTRDSGDTGVLHSDWLRKLTEATIAGEWQALEDLRRDAAAVLGAQQTTDVLTVAAAFNGITRVADATGIPLDDNTADTTAELRASTGIDDFAYAAKSARYG